jgi:hypothetical protein
VDPVFEHDEAATLSADPGAADGDVDRDDGDDYVVTEDRRRFRVARSSEELRGGQGTIDRLVGNQLAVKRPRTAEARKAWDDSRVVAVRRLPLEDLDISRPLFLLGDEEPGYVMHLIDGTCTVRTLIQDAPAEGESAWDRFEGYHAKAGVRRRLRLLATIAAVLARIHGRGLVYTDLSAGNVMVSEAEPHENVWLVDVDNVTVAGAEGPAPFTPGFAPPEFVTHRLPSRHADAYAFAVLAFRVLAQLHPLTGDQAPAPGPAEPIAWIEADAVCERFVGRGIPREHVLTPELRELFRVCFEDGLEAPDARPDLATWARALYMAADDATACPQCHRDRLGTGACPWCGERTSRRLSALLLDCLPGRVPVPTSGAHGIVALAPDGRTVIEERHRTGRLGERPLAGVLAIDRRNDKIEVRAMSGRSCQLVKDDAGPREVPRRRGLAMREAHPGRQADIVHLGPNPTYHRAVAVVPDPRLAAGA